MADDLRERIAKAIAGAVYGHNTRETAWADLHEDAQDEYLAEADAVIAELTDPIRGCTDMWHWSTGEPYRCPSCGYWMGEGYV